VLALWYGVAREVVERYGSQLDGKVVVDISNPIESSGLRAVDAGLLRLGTAYGSAVKLLG
jgi:predicted dinucleotide-binding enzyme